MGFEIFRVAVVKESNLVGSSLWDVLRLSELNLVKCGKEEKWRVRGGGQMSMVTLYNRVWFGTEVWDEYGHDILEAHRV